MFGILVSRGGHGPRRARYLATTLTLNLLACGTSPNAPSYPVDSGAEDAAGLVDASDLPAPDTESTDSLPPTDASNEPDSRPNPDADPAADAADVVLIDSGTPTDSADAGEGVTDLETGAACNPVVLCSPGSIFREAAAANPLLVEAGSLFTCLASDGGEPVLSDWSLSGGESPETRTDITAWTLSVAIPGVVEIAAVTGCGTMAPVRIEVLAPPAGTLIVASWAALADGFDFDADLYVRPNATACWDRSSETLVAWTGGRTLDWGVSGDESDDPHAGPDSRWSPGFEQVRCEQPSPTEVWEIGIQVPSMIPAALGPVRLRIWSAGSLIADQSRTWSPGAGGDRWWNVGSLQSGDGWILDGSTSADLARCGNPCDGGGTAWPEYCDGVDNDCNGTVDDSACSPGSVCLFIAEFDDYRCLAP